MAHTSKIHLYVSFYQFYTWICTCWRRVALSGWSAVWDRWILCDGPRKFSIRTTRIRRECGNTCHATGRTARSPFGLLLRSTLSTPGPKSTICCTINSLFSKLNGSVWWILTIQGLALRCSWFLAGQLLSSWSRNHSFYTRIQSLRLSKSTNCAGRRCAGWLLPGDRCAFIFFMRNWKECVPWGFWRRGGSGIFFCLTLWGIIFWGL